MTEIHPHVWGGLESLGDKAFSITDFVVLLLTCNWYRAGKLKCRMPSFDLLFMELDCRIGKIGGAIILYFIAIICVLL